MKNLMVASIFLLHAYVYGQVAINSTGNTPHASAMLDVQSTDKGILVPRIALNAANVATPVDAPADALLIYNTATAGTGVNAVQPGFYHWDAGAGRWMSMASSSTNDPEGDIGFGHWNDCGTGKISAYHPVTASDGMPDDYFGYAVAMSGDYAIIGAPLASPGGIINAGAVYVYHFDGTQWLEQQKIVSVNATSTYQFGVSVALVGDHAIIGAPGANTFGGVAEFYRLEAGTWEYQQTLSANDVQNNDNFGSELAMSGNSVIIGSNMADLPGLTNTGAAYIFIYNGTTWLQQGKLTANDAAPADLFGHSVSIFDDYAIVGAPNSNPSGISNAGAAYVFHFNGASWLQQQKLFASDGAIADNFAQNTVLYEDLAFVGAPNVDYAEPDTVENSGAVYVFRLLGGTWIEQQKIYASDITNAGAFGTAIAIDSVYAIITAPQDNSKQKATLFRNINGLWLEYEDFEMPGGAYDDLFGFDVSMDADRFLIGALRAGGFRGAAAFGKID